MDTGKHVIHESKSRQIDKEYLTGKKWNLEASYTILSSTLTWALCVRLTVFKVATWCRANGAHRRRHLVSDFLRLDRRLARSIAATCPGCSTFSSLVIHPDDPEEIVCLLRASLDSWKVLSSPLVADSNALAETAARSGEIITVFGVLSRADFTCQEGAVGLDIAVELASAIGPGWQKLLGQLKEAILPAQLFADTVTIRLPIPLDIRWRYQPCA